MAKFYGKIGYSETVDKGYGVWKEEITERYYEGELINPYSRRTTTSDSTNDDLTIDAQISIVADQFAYQKFHSIKYVEFMGAKWTISKVSPQFPRLILTLGGVYNGEQA